MANITKQPMCLVDTNKEGKLFICSDAYEQLKSLQGNVVVVGIAGLYRTGKSFLMNRLAGKNSGFPLGDALQSKTKGVWAWAIKHPKRKNCYLLLLDTEGLGDVQKGDKTHDNKIFTLVTLLSSTLVYNAKGTIDAEALEKLQFIAKLAEHIRVKNRPSGATASGNDDNFDFIFPDFIYALRDFNLDLIWDGMEITSDEYLERSLLVTDGDTESKKTFNDVKRHIRQYFCNRKCFAFIPPVAGRVTRLEEATDERLLPEFKEETSKFVRHIYENGPEKKISGFALSICGLAELTMEYVKQMNEPGGIPCVENAVKTMAQIENRRALEGAVQLYLMEMGKKAAIRKPCPDNDLMSDHHNKCVKLAVAFFLQKSVFDNDQAYQQQMSAEITSRYEAIKKENEGACKKMCYDTLHELHGIVRGKQQNGHYSKPGGFQLYRADITQLEQDYYAHLGKLARRPELLDFMHGLKSQSDMIAKADEQMTRAQQQIEAERQATLAAEKEAEYRQRQLDEQRLAMQDLQRMHKENLEQLEEKMTKQAEDAQKRHEEVMANRIAEIDRLHNEKAEKQALAFEQRVTSMMQEQERAHKDSMQQLLAQQAEQTQRAQREYDESLQRRIGELNAQHNERAEKQANIYREQLESVRGEINAYKNRGFLERLGALFTGN